MPQVDARPGSGFCLSQVDAFYFWSLISQVKCKNLDLKFWIYENGYCINFIILRNFRLQQPSFFNIKNTVIPKDKMSLSAPWYKKKTVRINILLRSIDFYVPIIIFEFLNKHTFSMIRLQE